MKMAILILVSFGLIVTGVLIYTQGYDKGEEAALQRMIEWQTRAMHLQPIHDLPWSYWTIQEKMFLCAFGSSGNRLNKDDMQKIQEKWGPK